MVSEYEGKEITPLAFSGILIWFLLYILIICELFMVYPSVKEVFN